MTDTPLLMNWTGDALVPHGRWWSKKADEQLVVGERYAVEVRHERSAATHKHQFAWLHEAWMNLPEHLSDLYPTSEHLRKRALIDAGFYNEMVVDCGNNAAALRAAVAFRSLDAFALVIVRGPVALIRRAKSQNHRSMDRAEFQKSKESLLQTISAMIGVPAKTLERQL